MKTVITLHQITHMHFYLTTPKSVQITPHDENKEQEKEAKGWRKRRLAFLVIFISSTLEKKTLEQGAISLTLFL